LDVNKARKDYFPITEDYIYMNAANHGPPSKPVQDAVSGFLSDWDRLSRRGDLRTSEACQTFAKLVNANPDEVCAQPNTSAGLAAVAESLSYMKGQNVVVNDLENAANIYPWMAQKRKGVELRVVKGKNGDVLLEDLEKLIDDHTKVVALSHVQWLTGAKADLKVVADITHDHGALLVVDGIQAAGSLKIDVKRNNVDFYAAGSYKWLLGPSGAGFLYVKQEHVEGLEPSVYGYRGARGGLEPKLRDTAKRLEFGEPAYLSFVGTGAAIEMILDIDPETIEKKVLKLSNKLHDGLSDLGVKVVSPSAMESRSGVVTFSTTDMEGLKKGLDEARFIISRRALGLRISANFYNTFEEVDLLLEHVGKHL
jgi:selenocysteine lyase/cysteine desulfurase